MSWVNGKGRPPKHYIKQMKNNSYTSACQYHVRIPPSAVQRHAVGGAGLYPRLCAGIRHESGPDLQAVGVKRAWGVSLPKPLNEGFHPSIHCIFHLNFIKLCQYIEIPGQEPKPLFLGELSSENSRKIHIECNSHITAAGSSAPCRFSGIP